MSKKLGHRPGLTFMSRSGDEDPFPLMSGCSGACQCHCHSTRERAVYGRGAQERRAGGLRAASDRDCREPVPHLFPPPPPLPAASFLTIICVLVFYHYYSTPSFCFTCSREHPARARCGAAAMHTVHAQIIAAQLGERELRNATSRAI